MVNEGEYEEKAKEIVLKRRTDKQERYAKIVEEVKNDQYAILGGVV